MARARICDDRGAAGLSWVVDEPMERTSHALAADGRVWLVDPVDDPQVMERVAELGAVVGVLQLLDRHGRDCAAIAARLGVPHHLCPERIEGAPFEPVRLTWRRGWREVALWWPDLRLLVVPEAVGANRFFTVGRGRLGVHPLLRLLPPRRLLAYRPAVVLTGHGGVLSGAGTADELRRAVEDARRGIPALIRTLPSLARRGSSAVRPPSVH